ncbi:MAG: HD domain-containing phosphohydrolase [Thalassotalea sp.]
MSDFLFQDEPEHNEQESSPISNKFWRILVIDDDEAVHQVTRLVLADAEIEHRKLEIISAFSSKEAKEILSQDDDFCMAFVDVVMETDHAGLELVDWIRNQMKNQAIRLVLRTGQAGNAPEARVIKDFDINDYKEKTDFTSSKMITTVYAGIRAYRDIMTIQKSLNAFKQLIRSTHDLLKINKIKAFGSAALNHLLILMEVESSALYIARSQIDFDDVSNNLILACTGKYVCESDHLDSSKIDERVKNKIKTAFTNKSHYSDNKCFVGYYETADDAASVLYIEFEEDAEHFRANLAELYATNVALILESITRQYEIERTQKELMYIVSEAVENQSETSSSHVHRVADICELMAIKLGLDEKYIQALKLAAPLHDIGKISIPEVILHKEGKLDEREWKVMQSHTEAGATMLANSTSSVSKLGASLARYHHENWDGSGYPKGLVAEEIPIEARIMAIADVFDVLGSRRCYKQAWSNEQIKAFINVQKGIKFEPRLVELLMENFDEFSAIRGQFPDND